PAPLGADPVWADHEDNGVDPADGVGSESRVFVVEPCEDLGRRAAEVGKSVDLIANSVEDLVKGMAQLPFASKASDDLMARSAASHVGDEVAKEPVDVCIIR